MTITRFRTTANGGRRVAASPRITDTILARHPAATQAPEPHTQAELDALLALLHGARATRITIGHGRHSASIATASAIADAWPGIVVATDWPATAASWLRPARRLVSGEPDAWVIADTPAGAAQLVARLVEQPGWTPLRTFGTASLDGPDLAELSGPDVLTGMRGPTATGRTWRIDNDTLTHDPITRACR